MTNQTTNNKGNGFPSIPKKWWLIGLCSFSILGGLVTYGYQTMNQQEKVKSDTALETVSSDPKDSPLETWEEQIKAEEHTHKKDEKSKTNGEQRENSVIDQILRVIIGEQEDSQTIFGIKIVDNDRNDRMNLIGELAKALDIQEAKEQKREAVQKDKDTNDSFLLLTNKPSSTEELIDLSKSILSDKKPEVILPENPGIDEEKPVVSDLPILPDEPMIPVLPDIPIVPVDPTPEPTPDPEPVPSVTQEEVDHTIDQLITTNRLALTTVKSKAEQVNRSLAQLKQVLDQLAALKETVDQTEEQGISEWQIVSDLVKEYNRLSQEIKKIIEVDGQVLPINIDLYRETYERLDQKVTEIKEAQKQANQTTTQMNESVQKAQETANRLSEMKQQYQDVQPQVSMTNNEIQATVSNAQSNEEVSHAVQKEIDQANQASETLATTNQVVRNQLEECEQTDYQLVLVQANQAVETVMNEANQQNSAVDSVLNDFQSLPTIEEVETPSTPETAPETPEMTDLSVNGQNQFESSMNTDTVDQSSIVPGGDLS